MNTHKKQKKLLTAAVMTALLATPGYGHAFEMPPEYVYNNGKPIVEMQFLTKGEGIDDFVSEAGYTLDSYVLLDGDDWPESEE